MPIQNIRVLLGTVIAMLLLSACGPSQSRQSTAEPPQDPNLPALEEAPANSPVDTSPAAYPGQESALPPTPDLNQDYPAPPTYVPTFDPYPGGLVWVIRPVGIQCEEGTAPGYGDLHQTKSTLTAAGIKVAAAETIELMVTASCGSPTSAHFRVQIAAEDLQTAQSMGWALE